MKKRFTSHRIGSNHQHGRHFIVFGLKYSAQDVVTRNCLLFRFSSVSLYLCTEVSLLYQEYAFKQ